MQQVREDQWKRKLHREEENNPDAELGKPYSTNADDLSHHELKRFYRTHDHFRDPVCFFLCDTAHYLCSINDHHHIDQDAARKGNNISNACSTLLCTFFCINGAFNGYLFCDRVIF